MLGGALLDAENCEKMLMKATCDESDKQTRAGKLSGFVSLSVHASIIRLDEEEEKLNKTQETRAMPAAEGPPVAVSSCSFGDLMLDSEVVKRAR